MPSAHDAPGHHRQPRQLSALVALLCLVAPSLARAEEPAKPAGRADTSAKVDEPAHKPAAKPGKKPSEKRAKRPGDGLLGEWWTEGREGRIRFVRHSDGTYRGITTCCKKKKNPDDPVTDIHNPNPKRRNRSTVGIVLIWKLRFEDDRFVDGYVYNPRDGDTYRFEAKLLDDDTLKIRGYLGLRILGQSQIWKRYEPGGK